MLGAVRWPGQRPLGKPGGRGQGASAPAPLQPGTLLVWSGRGGFWKTEAVTRIRANSDVIAMASA